MPEETNQQLPTPAPPQGQATPEINLPEESLKNYEITTMARDLKEESLASVIPSPEAPAEISPPPVLPEQGVSQEQPKGPTIREAAPSSSQGSASPDSKAFVEEKPSVQNNPPKEKLPELLDQIAKEGIAKEGIAKGGIKESSIPSMRYILIGFFAVVLIGLGGLGIYWYVTSSPSNPVQQPPPVAVTPPTPTPTPQATSTLPNTPRPASIPPQFDSPLVAVNKTLPLELKQEETSKEFLSTLKEAITQVSSQASEGDLIRIFLYREGKKISLSDVYAMLNSKPLDIERYLEGDSYTLFYRQGGENDVSFGLVAREADIANVKNNLPDLEKTSPDILQTLYKGYQGKETPNATSDTFIANTYKGIPIRYINFGSADIAIDYALYNKNLLLVAGSRKAMYALIDRLTLGL